MRQPAGAYGTDRTLAWADECLARQTNAPSFRRMHTIRSSFGLAASLFAGAFLSGCSRAGAPPTSGTVPAVSSASPDSTRPPVPPSALPAAAVDSFLVRFVTTTGEFDVVFRTDWAPHGVARVHEAVSARFYDGARFFRALRGFVVQFGIAADTARTAAWRGRRIPDDSVTESNRRGTVTFAAGVGANTRTVQLFVNLRDNARLDAVGFAPLGEVVRGMDVVSALYTAYGEAAPSGTGPSQDRITREGEPFLAREFPLLDQIHTARIVRSWPGRR